MHHFWVLYFYFIFHKTLFVKITQRGSVYPSTSPPLVCIDERVEKLQRNQIGSKIDREKKGRKRKKRKKRSKMKSNEIESRNGKTQRNLALGLRKFFFKEIFFERITEFFSHTFDPMLTLKRKVCL